MIKVVPFKKEHALELTEIGRNMILKPYMVEKNWERLELKKQSFSAEENGQIIFCGGIFDIWPGRGELWAMFREKCPSIVAVHRCVLRYLEIIPFKRIEAVVDHDFEEGHRWIKMLGFKCEAELMKNYNPNGTDASLYVRIK